MANFNVIRMHLILVAVAGLTLLSSYGFCNSLNQLDKEDVEAYLDVEAQLASIDTDQSGHHQKYIEQGAILFQTILETRQTSHVIETAEYSGTASIRGLSSELMSKLIKLYTESQMANTGFVLAECESLGHRISLVERQVGAELANLDRFLVACIHSVSNLNTNTHGNNNSNNDNAYQPNGNGNGNSQLTHADESWFKRLCDWFCSKKSNQ